MLFRKLVYLSLILFSCTTHSSPEFSSEKKAGFVIDSSYQFNDSVNNKILYRIYPGIDKDSFNTTFLTLRHYVKTSEAWKLKQQYDSLIIMDILNPMHEDMDGDGISDFVFLASQGIRGANFYTNLLVYDTTRNSFTRIKGFENVCAPYYDKETKTSFGTTMMGIEAHVAYLQFHTDTFTVTKVEVWDGYSLLRTKYSR